MLLQLGEGDTDLAEYSGRYSLVVCVYSALGTDTAAPPEKTRAQEWASKAQALSRLAWRLVAVSADRLKEQQQWLTDTAPSYLVLNDPKFMLAQQLGLRTIRQAGKRAYEPTTLIVQDRRFTKSFHATTNTQEIWTWLINHST